MMNELIKVNCDGDKQTISARTLWEFLDKPWGEFMKWFNQFKDYGFVENHDYRVIEYLLENPKGGRPATDYEITVEMAKELCMLQKSEKGKIARQYFIELEKAWNSPEMVMSRALKLAERKIMSLEEERQKLLPKAQSYDILMDASGCLTMNEVAKILDIKGVGQNNLFKLLLVEGIIYKKGNSYLPYQEYKSHFIVKQNPVKKGDAIIERSQLFMTPRGLDWLAHKLISRGYELNYGKQKIEKSNSEFLTMNKTIPQYS
ncbi:MAG TPA: antA/AntB antirepressor family protein [Cytophagaceae bacterium]